MTRSGQILQANGFSSAGNVQPVSGSRNGQFLAVPVSSYRRAIRYRAHAASPSVNPMRIQDSGRNVGSSHALCGSKTQQFLHALHVSGLNMDFSKSAAPFRTTVRNISSGSDPDDKRSWTRAFRPRPDLLPDSDISTPADISPSRSLPPAMHGDNSG